MPTSKHDIFKAFGELLYAISIADGRIQEEEKQLLTQLLSHHNYAFEILASFKSEANQARTIHQAYYKALDTFKKYGAFEGYPEFKVILEDLALSCEGISREERTLIDHFFDDLNDHLAKEK